MLVQCNPHSYSCKYTLGPGGGLFTRSGSAADPLFAERLPAIATITMIDGIHHDGCRVLSKKRRFEPRGRNRPPLGPIASNCN